MRRLSLSSNHLLVCRSAFCLKCYREQRPQKKNRFVVLGTTNQTFKVKTSHVDGLLGFTPHLYSIQFPYKRNEHDRVIAIRTCLMDGCGIEVGQILKDGDFALHFKEAEEVYMTEASAGALISLWRNSGYELL